MLNKKRLRKILIILLLIAIIIGAIILIRNTLARYETNATSEKDVDVAFMIVDNTFESNEILIDNIYPADTTYDYTFNVSNFIKNKKAETDLSYNIVLTTTTNLPLEYQITKNGSTCRTKQELVKDSDGTYTRKITLDTDDNDLIMKQGTDITDEFVIKVKFPKANNTNLEYADLVEYIKLNLTAKQIVEE